MSTQIGGYELSDGRSVQPGPELRRARRSSDHRRVLLRIESASTAAQLAAEADQIRAIGHPHLADPIEVLTDGPCSALVLDVDARSDLAELLRVRGRLTAGEIVTAIGPVAAALDAVHEHGLAYGDLGPDDIVFDDRGRPWLTGAGQCPAQSDGAAPGTKSPADLAPERARGGASSAPADLFALGSMLLRCLVGRPAWPAETVGDVVVQATVGQWPDPGPYASESPEAALAALARRLLDAEPDRRGPAGQAAFDLRNAIRPAPVRFEESEPRAVVVSAPSMKGPRHAAGHVRPNLTSTPARPPRDRIAKRHRVLRISLGLAGVAAVLVLAALGGLLWASWSGPSSSGLSAIGVSPAARDSDAVSAVPSTTDSNGTRHKDSTSAPAPVPRLATASGATSARGDSGDSTAARSTNPATDETASTPTPTPTPTSTSKSGWTAVMVQLDTQRASAIVRLDPSGLTGVYLSSATASQTAGESDGTGRAADAQLIRRMQASGQRVAGAAHRLITVRPMSVSAHRVRLAVTDALPSYAVFDKTGKTVGHTTGRGPQTRTVELEMTSAGWRIAKIG